LPSASLLNVEQVERAGEIHEDETLIPATGMEDGDSRSTEPGLEGLKHGQREIIVGIDGKPAIFRPRPRDKPHVLDPSTKVRL